MFVLSTKIFVCAPPRAREAFPETSVRRSFSVGSTGGVLPECFSRRKNKGRRLILNPADENSAACVFLD
jgi:hypothetical protein